MKTLIRWDFTNSEGKVVTRTEEIAIRNSYL